MSNHEISTVSITDSRISDITDKLHFGVYNGARNSTFQRFPFNSASNSSLSANIQIPSQSIVIDPRVLIQTDLNLTFNLSNVPVNQSCFSYGITDALNSYAIQSLLQTAQVSLNNAQVSTNYRDILPFAKLLEDKNKLDKLNSTSPDYVNEFWASYGDAILSNSSPMGNYNDCSQDNTRIPNGSYPATFIINHYVGGVLTNNSLISTSTSDTWVIYATFKNLVEPFLALNPFISDDYNRAGLMGINSIAMTLTVNDCSRVWTTGNVTAQANGWSSYINSITLGTPSSSGLGFTNSSLLFNFLTLSDLAYSQISTRNVTNYIAYDRYISPSSNSPSMAANTGGYTISCQNLQLSQVPERIIIGVRIPSSQQNWAYTDSFLTVNNISITWNNASGLLASASQAQLYNISKNAGSNQSFYSFRGTANAVQSGQSVTVGTLGSMIVINPARDLSMDTMLSNSSIGQFNLQINLNNVYNQYPFIVQPEVVIGVFNAGFICTELGSSQIFSAILNRDMVIEAKEQAPENAIDEQLYERVAGSGMKGMATVSKFHKHMNKKHHTQHKKQGGKHLSKSKLHSLVK
jgi:hypothetical protein